MPASVPVTADNFIRAESDLFFGNMVRDGGFGKFHHLRQPADVHHQAVIRLNRDTLYSAAVFDLDAGPVKITLPDPGTRFLSLQVLDEDEYVLKVAYGAGTHSFSRESVGTRYMMAGIRILVDPRDASDLKTVHALQDGVAVSQDKAGKFEIPQWDKASQAQVRQALLSLGETLPDSRHMFGGRDQVDPIRHLIGAATAWGGNPEKDALYLNVTPRLNDGKTIHRLSVKDVPVDGFWSITVYGPDGYLVPNREEVYSVNNITARRAPDGSVNVQFGGDMERNANCIPTPPGWNYIVRLYRPHSVILKGKWSFPEALPLQ